jgi:hypothetical protein
MARPTDLERMSHTELKQLEVRIERLKAQKREEERAVLREQITALARRTGLMCGNSSATVAAAMEASPQSTAIRVTLPTPGRDAGACRGGWPRR